MEMTKNKWAEYEARIPAVVKERARTSAEWVRQVNKCLSPKEWRKEFYANPIVFCRGHSESLDSVLRAYYWGREKEFKNGVAFLMAVIKERYSEVKGIDFGTFKNAESTMAVLLANICASVGCILTHDSSTKTLNDEAVRIVEWCISDAFPTPKSLFDASNAKNETFLSFICHGWLPLLLQKQYARIHDWYDRGLGWSTLEVEKNSARLVAKFCYMLARVGDGTADEGMRYGAAATLSQVKLDWLDSQIRGDSWLMTFPHLYLMQHLKHQVYGEAVSDPWKTFDELLPDAIMAEVKAVTPD